MDVVLVEVTIVGALIGPDELALTVLHALLVVALILGAIRPLFDTKAVLLVLVPLAVVPGSVEVSVNTLSICFVIGPFALVDVSLSMHESALSVSHAISPESIVSASVRPDLNASSIFLVFLDKPLALVDGSVLKHADWSDLPLLAILNVLLICPVKPWQLLYDFLNTELPQKSVTYKHYVVIVRLLEDFQLLGGEQV